MDAPSSKQIVIAMPRSAHKSRSPIVFVKTKLKWMPEEVHRAHREHQELFGGQADKIYAESLSRHAFRLNPEQASEQAKASVDFALNKLAERRAVFDEFETFREALRHGQSKLTLDNVREEVARRQQQQLLKVHHVRELAPGKRYTTSEAIKQEREILEQIVATKDARQQLENWDCGPRQAALLQF